MMQQTSSTKDPAVSLPYAENLSPAKDIEIEHVDDFSYDGFQVVRGEFFAHMNEPTLSFSNNKVYVNTACIRKLPEIDYVQMLVNPDEKKVCIRPCNEGDRDSFRWKGKGKSKPKQITCRMFFAKIMSMMKWDPNYRYKLLGKLIESGGELLFSFDLTAAEIFKRTVSKNGKTRSSRTPAYPEEWKNQFGLTVDEHQKSIQVNIFEGYAVFEIDGTQKKKTDDASSSGDDTDGGELNGQ